MDLKNRLSGFMHQNTTRQPLTKSELSQRASSMADRVLDTMTKSFRACWLPGRTRTSDVRRFRVTGDACYMHLYLGLSKRWPFPNIDACGICCQVTPHLRPSSLNTIHWPRMPHASMLGLVKAPPLPNIDACSNQWQVTPHLGSSPNTSQGQQPSLLKPHIRGNPWSEVDTPAHSIHCMLTGSCTQSQGKLQGKQDKVRAQDPYPLGSMAAAVHRFATGCRSQGPKRIQRGAG